MAKGRKTGGRKVGTPNKLNGDLKAYILDAAKALEDAGKGLDEWAKENPSLYWTQMFKGLLPRPLEVSGPGGKPIPMKMIVEFADNPGDGQDAGGG